MRTGIIFNLEETVSQKNCVACGGVFNLVMLEFSLNPHPIVARFSSPLEICRQFSHAVAGSSWPAHSTAQSWISKGDPRDASSQEMALDFGLWTYNWSLEMREFYLALRFFRHTSNYLIDFRLKFSVEKHFKSPSLRARVSPIQLLDQVPGEGDFSHLLTSSVFPLAEFLGMCPALSKCNKVIYFHENQLVYPIQGSRFSKF